MFLQGSLALNLSSYAIIVLSSLRSFLTMTDDAPKMNRTEGFGFHIVHNVVVIKMYSYFEGADKKVKRMRR